MRLFIYFHTRWPTGPTHRLGVPAPPNGRLRAWAPDMCRPRNHSMEGKQFSLFFLLYMSLFLVEPLYVTFWAILVYVGVLMIALECIVVTIFLIRHRITRRKEGAPEESNRPNRPGRRQGRENRGPPPLNVTRGKPIYMVHIQKYIYPLLDSRAYAELQRWCTTGH